MLEWTHNQTTCPTSKGCPGTTECEAFPTVEDRIHMAQAAYDAYAEADGTSIDDFVQDVALLVLAQFATPEDALRAWVSRGISAFSEHAKGGCAIRTA